MAEILKHPLETSIALDILDFEEFSVEEKMHIAISVKDFKAIILHAETLRTSVQASYSFPNRPLQLAYTEHGMQCEFTLMTIGDYRGSSTTPAPVTARTSPSLPRDDLPIRQVSAQHAQDDDDRVADVRSNVTMPPPSQPASRSFAQFPQTNAAPEELRHHVLSRRPSRPSPPPPRASLDPQSLFLPAGVDDDRLWDEPNLGEDDETLGWDASANQVSRYIKKYFANRTAHMFKGSTIAGSSRDISNCVLLPFFASMARGHRTANSSDSTPCGCTSDFFEGPVTMANAGIGQGHVQSGIILTGRSRCFSNFDGP